MYQVYGEFSIFKKSEEIIICYYSFRHIVFMSIKEINKTVPNLQWFSFQFFDFMTVGKLL